jgi:4-amino-4-deoxy-L-arabinose transferase-like glycosyltransferase
MGGVVMKPFIPKQHGTWAMLVIPFVLGAMAGGWSWVHIPLGLGWLFLYLASYPLLMISKKRNKNRRKPKNWSFRNCKLSYIFHHNGYIYIALFV